MTTVVREADEPLISVIMPTFNSARYIQQAVESVFQQTYPAHEVVVVDDGSTDDTRRVLGPYMESIRYVYQENQGPSAARNHGLGLARGEFVAFLDSDDYLLPGAMAEWLARFDSQPSLGAVHSGWRLVNQDGEVLRDVEPWYRVPRPDLETWVRGGPMCLGAMLFRRRWLDRVGPFDPELRQGEDLDLALRLALLGCKMAWLRKLTTCYRQHDYSATQGAVEQVRYREMVLDKFFARPDVPDQIRGLENEARLNASLWSVWRLYVTGHIDLVARYLRRSLAYSSEPPEQLVWKWMRSFAGWLSREDRQVRELHALLPHLKVAAGLDDERWSKMEKWLRFWIEVRSAWHLYATGRTDQAVEHLRRSLDYSPYPPERAMREWVRHFAGRLSRDGRQMSELSALRPHFQAAAGAEDTRWPETEEQLRWCMDVWWHYVDRGWKQAAEGLEAYRGLAPRELVSLAQSSLLVTPPGKMVPLVERFWEDARAGQLVPASYEHAVASLYLTAFGQAALGRRWRLAWKALGRALRWGYHPRAMGAWLRFFRAALAYYLPRSQRSVYFRLPPPTRFVVVSRGRTGSNFLLSLLRSHPAIQHHGEVVGNWELRRYGVRMELLSRGAVSYVESRFTRKGSQSAVGIKILYYHVENGYAQDWGIDDLPEILDFLKSNNDIKIIHLKRYNRLRTLVSVRVAAKTKQYTLVDDARRIDDVQIELSASECVEEFNRIGRWERKYDATFRDHEMLEVYYEDLAAHTARECGRILDFLGVGDQPLFSKMLKQSKRTLPDIVKNYEALKRQFADTEWERFFED